MSTLSRRIQYLPRSYRIDPETITLPVESYSSGPYTELYHGTQNGESVAVKVLRTSNKESLAKLMEVSARGECNTLTWADTTENSVSMRS